VQNSPDRLRDLVEHAVRASQPAAALRAMNALREELDAFERLQVARALDAGQSFSAVARSLGISRQAAHRRYRDLAGVELPDDSRPPNRGRVLVTSEARAAVTLAKEEATALGARTVGSEHLLLGIIRSRASSVAELLERGGVTLADARRSAQPTLIDGGPEPTPEAQQAGAPARGISAYARSVFDHALQEAVKRGDGYVGVDHILLASLEDPKGGASRTLTELGLEPDDVRAALAS
jgi:transposase-like protein